MFPQTSCYCCINNPVLLMGCCLVCLKFLQVPWQTCQHFHLPEEKKLFSSGRTLSRTKYLRTEYLRKWSVSSRFLLLAKFVGPLVWRFFQKSSLFHVEVPFVIWNKKQYAPFIKWTVEFTTSVVVNIQQHPFGGFCCFLHPRGQDKYSIYICRILWKILLVVSPPCSNQAN